MYMVFSCGVGSANSARNEHHRCMYSLIPKSPIEQTRGSTL